MCTSLNFVPLDATGKMELLQVPSRAPFGYLQRHQVNLCLSLLAPWVDALPQIAKDFVSIPLDICELDTWCRQRQTSLGQMMLTKRSRP